MPKTNTRVTFDIPTVDHKRLKMLAAYQGKSMRQIFVELIEEGLEHHQDCLYDHTPNETTKKALEAAKTKRGSQKASNVQELFKKLGK